MLRQLLAVLLLILLSPHGVQAQNTTPSAANWPVSKRCLGDLPYPSLPPNKWTFKGVIFSDNRIGVRAIRTDVATSYYVALDGDDSFALEGSFSPDGKRFVYPTGTTQYATMISNAIGVYALQVVSTDPRQVRLTIPWNDFGFSGFVSRGIASPKWLDNNHFISGGAPDGQSGRVIVNAVTGELTPWSRKTDFPPLFALSPDAKRAFYYVQFDNGGYKLYDIDNDQLVTPLPERFNFFAWLPDSSAFVGSVSQVDSQDNVTSSLIIFDKNGLPITDLISNSPDPIAGASVSPDGKHLTFFVGSQLFVADLDTRQITDLCFDTKSIQDPVAWSPDNTSFVMNYGGFPVIVNYQTLDMQILRYEVYRIWGWYPLD